MYAKFGQDVGTMPETDEEEESRLNNGSVCRCDLFQNNDNVMIALLFSFPHLIT